MIDAQSHTLVIPRDSPVCGLASAEAMSILLVLGGMMSPRIFMALVDPAGGLVRREITASWPHSTPGNSWGLVIRRRRTIATEAGGRP